MSSADDSQAADGSVEVLLITPPQAAAMCQISVDKIYEWAKLPGFPVIRGPHQLRIHARMFEQWLEKRAAEEDEFESQEVEA